MSKFEAISCAVALLVSLSCVAGLRDDKYYIDLGEDRADQKNDFYAVDFVTQDNLHFRFPYFRNDIRTIDQHLRQQLLIDIDEVLNEANKNIQDLLQKPPSGFLSMFKWVSIGKDFMTLIRKQEKDRNRRGLDSPFGLEFTIAMKKFFIKVLDRSKEVEKKLAGSRIDRELMRRDIQLFVNSLSESLWKSPVASFLDWTTATVNGKPLEQYLSDLIGRLRHHDFNTVFSCIGTILKI